MCFRDMTQLGAISSFYDLEYGSVVLMAGKHGWSAKQDVTKTLCLSCLLGFLFLLCIILAVLLDEQEYAIDSKVKEILDCFDCC